LVCSSLSFDIDTRTSAISTLSLHDALPIYRIAIIDHGRVVVAGALDDLRENFRRIQLVFDGDAPEAAFRTAGVERVRRKGRVLTVLSSAGAAPVLDEARALGAVSVDVVPVTLKEIFLETVSVED